MQVLVLRVTCLTLETLVTDFAINQHVTSEFANACVTTSQAVKQCSLGSARDVHMCRQCAGLYPAVEIVQNMSQRVLNFNVIAHISPVKHIRGSLKAACPPFFEIVTTWRPSIVVTGPERE